MTQTNEAAFETVIHSGLEKHVVQCNWSQPADTNAHTQVLA
jgi:hypothetical protein